MAVSSDEIYSLLVPLDQDRLIVPRASVAEVIRYSAPTEGNPESWMCGFVNWTSVRIPVVSLERLCGMPPPVPAGRTRIVVIHPVSGEDVSPYGILAEGFPQMVRVSREILELDQSYKAPEGSPLLCKVRMLHEQALIPDLEAIEAKLADLLANA